MGLKDKLANEDLPSCAFYTIALSFTKHAEQTIAYSNETLPGKSEVPEMRLLVGRKLCYTIHPYYDEVS